MKKAVIIISIVNLIVAGGLLYYFVFMKKLDNQIIIPYISHQKPQVDPHVPGSVPLSDKLDEVIFDGLFNVSANASGITYEDALGEYIDIDSKSIVTVRLKSNKKWHSSYDVTLSEKGEVTVSEKAAVEFIAKDLKFTLRRIKKLGSLSPDNILIAQAVANFDFSGPDENGEVKFKFGSDRIWTENDIKEILSFKILPASSEMNAANYDNGTGPYMQAGEFEGVINYIKNPAGKANVENLKLNPYIDNSTYTTELKNKNINTMLSTPFGSVSPILADTNKFFYKSSIATTFFSLFFNTEKLDRDQRHALRKLIDGKKIMDRFFRVGTEQQRHISNYKGGGDNYSEYLNKSVFPATSYYVDEEVVVPVADDEEVDMSILPDTIHIQTCINHGMREELSSLVEIMNDPALFNGRIKVTAVKSSDIQQGNYDAVLVPVSGYRSNFLFDLYDVFLREPDFASHKIALQTSINRKKETVADASSFTANRNFFRLDSKNAPADEQEDIATLLEYLYGFMSTHEIGDKQAYAQYIDELENNMALGSWLFSLPSLAYFRTQFKKESINLYGVASQLSTIEEWEEVAK